MERFPAAVEGVFRETNGLNTDGEYTTNLTFAGDVVSFSGKVTNKTEMISEMIMERMKIGFKNEYGKEKRRA